MRSHLGPLGLVALALSAGSLAAADDEPKAVIDRAIQAQGGGERLGRIQAFGQKVRGTVYSKSALNGADVAHPFTAVVFHQPPSQFRHHMVYDNNGLKITQIQVCNDNQVSIRVNDQMLNLSVELRDSLLKLRYADNLSGLTVLRNKEYTLSALGESKVEGRPAVGVKVVSPDRPEVHLFFDKQTGLLIKSEHRQKDPRQVNGLNLPLDMIQETYFRDYRVLDTTADDERVLKTSKFGVEGKDLLEFFRIQLKNGGDRGRILALIRQLGDDAFDVREKATAALLALGEPAVPFLKDARKADDLEVVRRAERILQQIGAGRLTKENTELPVAAARLLALRKPAGAAELLLDYLPLTADPDVAREVRAALAAVAQPDGKPDPALLKALDGNDALRREAAAEALGRIPTPPGRKLLLTGIKRPAKVEVYRAGRKFMEWEVGEITFFNKLDDKTFTQP